MAYQPPHRLEQLASVLLPPASAEHALGDLAECSRANTDYLRNLASILPRVVWSQIRRRATLGGVIFQAVLTGAALLAFQGVFKSPLFLEPWGPLRLAAIWVIWVCGCALAAAYGPRERPTSWSRAVFLGTIAACVGSAIVLGVPLAPVVAALGATFGTLLLLSMPWLTQQAPPPLSADTLPAHARAFQRTIWWRNARESLACLLVIGFTARGLWTSQTPLERTGQLLIIAGVAFILGYLHLRAASRPLPPEADLRTIWQFHRRELARQRDILRAIVWWYLMPFVPGFLVSTASRWQGAGHSNATGATDLVATIVGSLIVVGVFAFIWRLNLWGARWLDGELQKVDALEGQL